MVTIRVRQPGETSQDFVVHKVLICEHSKYFRAAFSGNYTENQKKLSRINDVSLKIFMIFGNWLYN